MPKALDINPLKCIIKECNNFRIWDPYNERYLPICGYNCFIKGR